MGLTSDRNDPGLKRKGKRGLQETYLVDDGEGEFVRPVRRSYIHVGKVPHYKSLYRKLSKEESDEYPDKNYVAVMTVVTKEDGNFLGGSYVTQDEYDAWEKGERVGGCGTVTTMHQKLAETYARNPKFYGATYCAKCQKHLPVGEYGEFVWDGTDEMVGT